MPKAKRTPAGEAMSSLMLELFRLNSRLMTAGDRLVAPLGLTSARWQVLGTIFKGEHPQPVAWLARNLGANRQNVQRIVNDLEKEELVAFETNPHHRRAQLVVLTDRGKEVYAAAMALQAPWINSLSDGIALDDIKTTQRVMASLRLKLEQDTQEDEQS
ncbi:Transcriptional activatory protein BadR [compost metagenome]